MKHWTKTAAVGLLAAAWYVQAQNHNLPATTAPASSQTAKTSDAKAPAPPSSNNKATKGKGAKGAKAAAQESGKYFQEIIVLKDGPEHTAVQIVDLLKQPLPYSVVEGADKKSVVIYCSANKPADCDSALLQKIETDVHKLAGMTSPYISEVIRVAHASALGDVLAKVQSLHYKGLQIEEVGPDRIRVTRPASMSLNPAILPLSAPQQDSGKQQKNGTQSEQAETAKKTLATFKATNKNVFPVYCFREAVEAAFPPNRSGTGYYPNSYVKPLRGALANFLFQYKMSQQYPHEFSGFGLSQSDQELNSELNPLIVAFNRDVAAALRQVECLATKCRPPKNGHWGWQGHTNSFVDNGIVTVRTVSGKETVVDTETQSFFDVTEVPSITDVINSVGEAEGKVPKVLKSNLTANEAAVIIGALNSVKPATSQVGRKFMIDITPHSLSGASSAELEVHLLTGDSAPPTRYSEGKSSSQNLSQVSKNDTQTKVRLESIKLFEISSFSAELRQSRNNFPLVPPFVEIPYIGALLSVPVPGAKEYHRSTAVISAVVVPTAADLASGVVFRKDRLLFPGSPGKQFCKDSAQKPAPCFTVSARSLSDFDSLPINEYNRRIVRCFSSPEPHEKACNAITFDDVLPMQ